MFDGPASARSYKIGVVSNNWLVGWLVGNAVFSETALRIFLIFCMTLEYYKGTKVTVPNFWKKILDLEIFAKSRSKLAQNQTLWYLSQKRLKRFFWFWPEIWPSIWIKPIFEKNLQFGDIWPRNRKKIVQIEVFGHFLDFATLVFLDFAHNDRWAWCLVVFLQFGGPVNVFLFIFLFWRKLNWYFFLFENFSGNLRSLISRY